MGEGEEVEKGLEGFPDDVDLAFNIASRRACAFAGGGWGVRKKNKKKRNANKKNIQNKNNKK